MCDIAALAVLDRYAAKFRERVDRFSDAWYLCMLADTRCRSKLWESEFRRQSQFHDTNPELSAFVPSRPWNSVIRASANDRDFWKEELEDKVSDVRNVRRVVEKAAGGGKDRSRSRRREGTKQERGRDGGPHPQRGPDGRHRTTATGSQICFAYNRAPDGCATVCPTNRKHVCEFCLEPHRSIECPRHPGWTPPAKGVGSGFAGDPQREGTGVHIEGPSGQRSGRPRCTKWHGGPFGYAGEPQRERLVSVRGPSGQRLRRPRHAKCPCVCQVAHPGSPRLMRRV